MVHKLNQKIFNLKVGVQSLNKHDCVWYTWKKGDIIPGNHVETLKAQGANLVEVGEEVKVKKEKKEKVKEEKKEDGPKPELVDVAEKLSEQQLYKLNKSEQVELLNKLGADKIPRWEKGRVELLLQLQG